MADLSSGRGYSGCGCSRSRSRGRGRAVDGMGWMGIPSHLSCLGLIPETAGRAVRFQRAGAKLAETIVQLAKAIAMSFSHSSLAEV